MEEDAQIQSAQQPQGNKDTMGMNSTDTSMVSQYQPQANPMGIGSGLQGGDTGDDEKKNLWRSLL